MVSFSNLEVRCSIACVPDHPHTGRNFQISFRVMISLCYLFLTMKSLVQRRTYFAIIWYILSLIQTSKQLLLKALFLFLKYRCSLVYLSKCFELSTIDKDFLYTRKNNNYVLLIITLLSSFPLLMVQLCSINTFILAF